MKYPFIFIPLILSLIACDRHVEFTPNCYDEGTQIRLSDGALAQVVNIVDNRCPCSADCLFAGEVGMTLLIGTDTILTAIEGYGMGTQPATTDPTRFIYQTRRGDRIEVLDYGPNDLGCPGSNNNVFCLEINVLE